MYIAIEGIDTAGKSTQIELLKNVFNDFLFITEPGFTPLGEKLRDIIFKFYLRLSQLLAIETEHNNLTSNL